MEDNCEIWWKLSASEMVYIDRRTSTTHLAGGFNSPYGKIPAEHGFYFLGLPLSRICEIIYYSLSKNGVFNFIMKNVKILININCQALCHQSWLAVWRNAWKALLRESGSIHIVLLLTYSLIVSFNVISVASEYQIHPNSANIDKVKINTICWIFWKLFWDSIPKTFLGQIFCPTWLLRRGWGVGAIRGFVSNPKPTTCPLPPKPSTPQ